MKTAIDTIRKALESAHHQFQNILDYGVAEGSDRDKVRAEQDILKSALASLKSLEGEGEHSEMCGSFIVKHIDADHGEPYPCDCKETKPSVLRLTVDDAMEVMDTWINATNRLQNGEVIEDLASFKTRALADLKNRLTKSANP